MTYSGTDSVRLIKETLPTAWNWNLNYSYDSTYKRPTSFDLKKGSGSEFANSFTYEAAGGRLDTITATGSATAYDYNYQAYSDLVASITHGSHNVIRMWENHRNLLKSIDTRWNSTSKAKYAYRHDALGRRPDVTQPCTMFEPPSSYLDGGTPVGGLDARYTSTARG